MARVDLNLIIRNLRIISGLLLFTYSLMHLLNHSVNLISYEVADLVREKYFSPIWQSFIALVLLYSSFIVHILLGIYAIVRKKSFKMTLMEWAQLVMPFLALLLLIQHVAAGFIITKVFGGNETYELVFAAILSSPDQIVLDSIFWTLMTLFIWLHGVIGIHGLLKFKSEFYVRNFHLINFFYWIIPIFSILGFIAGLRGLSVLNYIKSLQGLDNYIFSVFEKNIPQQAFPIVFQIEPLVLKYYPIVIAVLLLVILINIIRARFFGSIVIKYSNNQTVLVPKGTTVLEASRMAGIPHQSICGGKGRCTTCRIRILSNATSVPDPNEFETRAILKNGWDKDIRLACQLRPINTITILPILNPGSKFQSSGKQEILMGTESEIAILFVDLRNFTDLSERKLPFDVVYILNKYYEICGEAIERHSGRLDKFIGDGIMAIFDKQKFIEENSRNAIKAAKEISSKMHDFNRQMKTDFSEELKLGMGVHAGSTIVGLMGYGSTISETAVGDNVNIASRLETLTKDFECELVLSKYVVDKSGLNSDNLPSESVKLRGKADDFEIVPVKSVTELVFLET